MSPDLEIKQEGITSARVNVNLLVQDNEAMREWNIVIDKKDILTISGQVILIIHHKTKRNYSRC